MLSRTESEELSTYSAHVQKYARLSRERERELAVRYQATGDAEARQELINANLRFVIPIALKYKAYKMPIFDLIGEGNIGLMKALDRFDPERGIRFITYAAFWIRAEIVRSVLSSWKIARSGGGPLRSKLFFKLRRERSRALTRFGEGEAAEAELELRLGMSRDEFLPLYHELDTRDVSLDEPTGAQDSAALVDRLPSTAEGHDTAISQARDLSIGRELVREALSVLDSRERFIIEQRLLAHDDDELSLAEVGRKLGVSRERARQLSERAKMKLSVRIRELSALRGVDPVELLAAA